MRLSSAALAAAALAAAAPGRGSGFSSPPGLEPLRLAIERLSERERRAPAAVPAAAPSFALWRGRASEDFVSESWTLEPFDRAVLSWNMKGGGSFELEADGSGVWHSMGRWGERPRSARGPRVLVDTLVLPAPARSLRFRFRPEPGAELSMAAITSWRQGAPRPLGRTPSPAWGATIDVPRRSQGASETDPARVCSPTALAMVLEHHGVRRPTEQVAAGVLDHAEGIYGNWPFNTAYAHREAGLEAYVRSLPGFEELEAEIAAGRPVVISHRWERGELDDAPIPRTDGHVIVVVGFTREGDVVVNDPAARERVRRVYKRAQLHKTWLGRGSGVAYILRPLP